MKGCLLQRLRLLLVLVLVTQCVYAQVYVNGYTRKNGTHVQPHYRSSPDGLPTTNWSYPGNVNPITGKIATGDPDTYLRNYNKSATKNRSSSPMYNPNSYYSTPFYSSPNNGGSYYNLPPASNDYAGGTQKEPEKHERVSSPDYTVTQAIVRAEPDVSSKEITRLNARTPVYLLDRVNDFYKVQIYNTVGYVSYLFIDLLDIVAKDSLLQTARRNTYYTKARITHKATFRQGPYGDASAAGEIPAGTDIPIEGRLGDYYYTNYQGVNGYIHEVWLSQIR